MGVSSLIKYWDTSDSMVELLFGTAGIPHSTKPDSSIEGIRQVKKLGLNCMELEFVQGIRINEPMAARIAEVSKETGIYLSVHAPYFINLNSSDIKILHNSRQRLLQSAHIGQLCGAGSVVFHPGFYMKKKKVDVFRIISQEISKIATFLKDRGNQIILRPEITGRVSSFGDMEEILQLSSVIENVLPCIDFAHLHARTGRYNSYEEFCNVLQRVQDTLGNGALENMHIHIAGIQYGQKGEKRHLNLHESDLNYHDLLKALNAFQVKGMVICESPSIERDALLLKTIYSSLHRAEKKRPAQVEVI